jgi:hypothetical protein
MLGPRSFATWTAGGRLVFDSGDDLEQIIAEGLPECFNCSDSSINFDGQNADRGPEPERLTVGPSTGGPMLSSHPSGSAASTFTTSPIRQLPSFQQYINFRNFSVDPGEVCERTECCRKGAPGWRPWSRGSPVHFGRGQSCRGAADRGLLRAQHERDTVPDRPGSLSALPILRPRRRRLPHSPFCAIIYLHPACSNQYSANS